MPTSPDRDDGVQRERTARCLLAYMEQLPMSTEHRLELTLETLRELPVDATLGQALNALLSRLPTQDPAAFPPGHPPVIRSHMPAQYLGRPRKGFRAFALQWGWLIIVGLLLILTLLLNSPK